MQLKGTLTDAYVWDGAQGPEGYMILSVAQDRMDIRECLAVSDDAFLGLLGAMGSLDSQTDQLVWDALPGTALDRWVSAPDQLKIAQTDQGMFRIVNLPAALEARRLRWPGAGGRHPPGRRSSLRMEPGMLARGICPGPHRREAGGR